LEPKPNQQSLEYKGIRISPAGVSGVQAGRVYAIIPHSNIRCVTLRRGSPSAHPLIQIVVGAFLAATGVPIFFHLFHWIAHGGMILSAEELFLTFPAIGVILVFSTLRSSFYLIVEKKRGRAKLAFDSGAKLNEVRTLLDAAKSVVQYPIEIDSTIPR
jgi:hypothetical protein